MTTTEFLRLLEEDLEVKEGELEGNPQLNSLSCWDSVATMTFMALVNDTFQTKVSAEQITNCKTLNDLLGLLGDKLKDNP